MKRRRSAMKNAQVPTGVDDIDRLANLAPCTLEDYVKGASAYVRRHATLTKGAKKAGQIRLSNALARSLVTEIEARLPHLKGRISTEEQKVAGGLRTAKADVSESHKLDGLRIAVELKPINLAVGRAIWNRFGDIRAFSVNIHLKFPFAVVGGVLAIPTYEETGTTAATEAEREEIAEAENTDPTEIEESVETIASSTGPTQAGGGRKSTTHLIDRAVERLVRAGGRRSEAEAAHLLEGIAVVVYNPDTARIDPTVPKPGTGLRWEEFVDALVASYRARFED